MKQMTNVDKCGSSASKFRYMMLTVLLALMSMVTISCSSDDDEPIPTINDYYVEFKFSGGGLSEQQLSKITNSFNNSLQDNFSWTNVSSAQAEYYFGKVVDAVRETFADGYSDIISGTMNVTVILKTKDGRIVKTEVVRVTRTGLA